LLIPKRHLGRAGGTTQLGPAVAQVLSPVLGSVLLTAIEIQGVILIDFTTFLFALGTLLLVQIPKPATTAAGKIVKGSLLTEAASGWTYIAARPGLLGLLACLAVGSFLVGVARVLAIPLVLAYASAPVFGVVLSVGGSGMLVGSLIMSLWGGSKRRIY